MSEWYMYVSRHENGYEVDLYPSNSKDQSKGRDILVFQDDDEDGLKSIEQVLWEIVGHFGKIGSKHDKERIVIRRERI